MTRTLSVVLLAMSGVGALSAQAPRPRPPATVHPRDFNSPDEAANALVDAAVQNNTQELAAILGSDGKGILTSGDQAQDREERQEFSQLATRKHRIEHSSMDSSSAVLLVGDDDWPFPVPLVRTGQQWHFDPGLGSVEMRARRIGADELDAIEICMGYVGAQETYAEQKHSGNELPAYAQKIMSSPGGKDGLYQTGAGQPLVPEGFAKADAALPPGERKAYHGYYFRVLKEQGPGAPGGNHRYLVGGAMIGGFGLVAWPAEYGVSGIHTFMVNHDGQVFERDFGPRTASLVLQVNRYDPDETWTPVD